MLLLNKGYETTGASFTFLKSDASAYTTFTLPATFLVLYFSKPPAIRRSDVRYVYEKTNHFIVSNYHHCNDADELRHALVGTD